MLLFAAIFLFYCVENNSEKQIKLKLKLKIFSQIIASLSLFISFFFTLKGKVNDLKLRFKLEYNHR